MKHSQINNVTSLLESTQSSENKLKSIQSLIKQICSPESIDWDEASGKFKQVVVQKKMGNGGIVEPTSAVEKTTKIKKNKRKNKKKSAAPTTESIMDKIFPQQICGCCSGKLECTPTHDGYESQEEYYTSDSHIESIIESIGEELLECFYDEIDKAVVRIMKDVELQHSRTFIRLMRKLGDIFEDFDQDFREEIEKELEGETLSPMETGWTVCEEFKTYIITRFPLLKDFIENFKLAELDEKQAQQFTKLQYRSPLIQSIYIHMQEIAAKKSKKKHKRQLQKLNKKSQETGIPVNCMILEAGLNGDGQQYIVERLKNLKIKDLERSQCFFDYQKFNKYQKQLTKNDK